MKKEKDAESICSSENLSELIAALKFNHEEKTIMSKPKARFDYFTYSVVIILLCLFVGGLIVNMNHLNTIMEDMYV
ncbi:hypothetical protein CAEBREN_00521 [Caenorhabditis brenneri]|uniref:Uncharacterized protein n=1 Tax=Caenorhabditis brenneri TaxID=135651 RepID=G0NFY4_CAEBE|nr:hypothetical protein CAEBREN_00521 [Caenorhabditis brenneri]